MNVNMNLFNLKRTCMEPAKGEYTHVLGMTWTWSPSFKHITKDTIHIKDMGVDSNVYMDSCETIKQFHVSSSNKSVHFTVVLYV